MLFVKYLLKIYFLKKSIKVKEIFESGQTTVDIKQQR